MLGGGLLAWFTPANFNSKHHKKTLYTTKQEKISNRFVVALCALKGL